MSDVWISIHVEYDHIKILTIPFGSSG